jgi:hypothetical protein
MHYERHFSHEADERLAEQVKFVQRWFQKKAGAWFASKKDPSMPDGFRVLRATVYTDGERLVVTANPDDLWPGYEDHDGEHPHNCDQMGCNWEHVVARTTIGRAR